MDAKTLATLNGGTYEITPDALYPAALAEVQAKIALDDAAYRAWTTTLPEQTAMFLRTLRTEAKRLPADSWALALQSKADVPAERHADRAAALEIARRWFTEVLHYQCGYELIGLRILRSEDGRFRL